MACFTDPSTVQQTFSTSLTSAQISQLINDAHAWIITHLIPNCPSLPFDALEVIERYLTIGFMVQRNPILRSARVEDIAETYAVDSNGLHWFRLAAGFDNCGIVAEHFLDKKLVKGRVGRGFGDMSDK